MKNDLSIVIPVHNRAELVEDTLASVASQTLRPLHVILVDNNSTDGTAEVLRRWKDDTEKPDFRITVLSESRPGACAARNAGLEAVDTEWTMFFDSDDIMHAGHAERAMTFAAAHPDADIVGWDVAVNYISGSTQTKHFILRNIRYNNIMHSSFATQRYMARTSLFRKAGGWTEGLTLGDDVEIGNRLLALNPNVYKIPGVPTVEIYESEVSITHGPGRLRAIASAMTKIASDLPENQRHWADLQAIILAAFWTRNADEATEVAGPILARTPRPRKWLWDALFRWTLRGGRGAARVYELIKWTGI